jgi:hypothetical protein
MSNRLVHAAAAAVAICTVAGCSSPPAAAPHSSATLPGATARVTVAGKDTDTTHAIKCSFVGWMMTITIGSDAAGVTAVVQHGDKLDAKSVSFNNIGGFTGGYWQDLQGRADVSVARPVYTISGTAVGFNSANPSGARTPETFAIKFAC